MRLILCVSGGALDGRRFVLSQERILVGRDPAADVRFDADNDRQVSARHAEIRWHGEGWQLRDLNSTNGTFRNGSRVHGDSVLHDGDRVALGVGGPMFVIESGALAASGSVPQGDAPIAVPVRPKAARTSRLLIGGVVAAVVIAVGLTTTAVLRGRRAVAATPAPSAVEGPLGVTAVASSGGEMDFAAVNDASARAVALVAVQMPGGAASSGTAFAVGERLLVTNRHVIEDEDGTRARRVLVKFSETEEWLPAIVERVDRGADLATLLLEEPARAPRQVRGIAAAGTAPRVGDPVVLIGYPLGIDTPMEQTTDDFIAAPSVFRGMVSKSVQDVLQVDAFAGHGSSGSPILDRRGAVVGVVYGGPAESGGRIVYAVSPTALLDFLAGTPVTRIP